VTRDPVLKTPEAVAEYLRDVAVHGNADDLRRAIDHAAQALSYDRFAPK